MKRIFALTTLVFFLLGGVNVFALDPESPIVSTTQSSTIRVTTAYNPYGVAISSTSVTTTQTTTTNEKGETSTTTTVSTSQSEWRGGSLKIASASGTSDTSASDGSSSHTDFWTNYSYNANGQLAGATGESYTKRDEGLDAKGESIGTSESTTVDHYIIKNGQALRSSSATTGTAYGPDGEATSYFTETSNYSYELIGGTWHIMGEVSTNTSNEVDGSNSTITRTRSYQRDANGVATGITQSATGTRTAVNENGGSTTYGMQNYQATFAYDPKAGWYLSNESYDWADATPSQSTPNPGDDDGGDPGDGGDLLDYRSDWWKDLFDVGGDYYDGDRDPEDRGDYGDWEDLLEYYGDWQDLPDNLLRYFLDGRDPPGDWGRGDWFDYWRDYVDRDPGDWGDWSDVDRDPGDWGWGDWSDYDRQDKRDYDWGDWFVLDRDPGDWGDWFDYDRQDKRDYDWGDWFDVGGDYDGADRGPADWDFLGNWWGDWFDVDREPGDLEDFPTVYNISL